MFALGLINLGKLLYFTKIIDYVVISVLNYETSSMHGDILFSSFVNKIPYSYIKTSEKFLQNNMLDGATLNCKAMEFLYVHCIVDKLKK